MIPFPLSTWPAPPPLPIQYGTVALAVVFFGYLFGGRYLVGATPRNDATVALIITIGTAAVGFIVLSGFRLEVWLSYAYGIILGLAIYHYSMLYLDRGHGDRNS